MTRRILKEKSSREKIVAFWAGESDKVKERRKEEANEIFS